MKKALRTQYGWVGRLARELERQLNQLTAAEILAEAKTLIKQAKLLIAQATNPKQQNLFFTRNKHRLYEQKQSTQTL